MASRAGALAKRQNKIFAANLKRELGDVPKKTLAGAAAALLYDAVKATTVDSGRAAANWDLWSGPYTTTLWSPAIYGQTTKEGYQIGYKGDYSGDAEEIANGKLAYNGASLSDGLYPVHMGRLWRLAGIGRPGPAPMLVLYNPIYGPESGPYAQRAFGATMDAATFEGNAQASVYHQVGGVFKRAVDDMAKMLRGL